VSALVDVGDVIAGKFELVRLLGRGSMGEVWVAHHRTLGENVALKLLSNVADGAAIEDSETAAARFRFEAQIAARLSRKTRHIVRVTDHGEEDGLAYLVMELLDGQTLDELLLRQTPLPADVVADVIAQVARALTHAHAEGVFHRDLKPANVFMSHDEDGRRLIKVLDFGIARAIHAHRVRGTFATARGLVFGTPGYMSPEQAVGSAKLDHRCDLWALAVIAYEALSGTLPTEGQEADEILKNVCAGHIIPLRERLPNASPALSAFFSRAFARSMGERFGSASELAEQFAWAAGVQPLAPLPHATAAVAETVAPPAEELEPATHEAAAGLPRRSWGAPLLVALGLLAAVAFGAGAWRARSGPAAAPTMKSSGPPAQLPSAEAKLPGIDVDDLPRAQAVPSATERTEAAPASGGRSPAHPLSAARGPVVPMVTSSSVRVLPGGTGSTATATVAPPAPASAPAPRSTAKSRDKSDVL
jgi:eukaryotic-like serine/threonine-protein kinase